MRGRAVTPLKTALAYARWGWPVMVGAAASSSYATELDGISGVLEPTTHLGRIRQWWEQWPEAGIVSPAGEVFEVITLPRRAGQAVLESLTEGGAWLSPVMSDDGTLSLLIDSGQADLWADLPSVSRAGLLHIGLGQLITLPSGADKTRDRIRWVVPPTDANASRLPSFQLLSPILQSVCRPKQRRQRLW